MQPLIRLILGMIIGVAMIPVATLADNSSVTEKPLIEFEKKEHDFGEQISGVPLHYAFIFRNKGSAPLFIEKVKAG